MAIGEDGSVVAIEHRLDHARRARVVDELLFHIRAKHCVECEILGAIAIVGFRILDNNKTTVRKRLRRNLVPVALLFGTNRPDANHHLD